MGKENFIAVGELQKSIYFNQCGAFFMLISNIKGKKQICWVMVCQEPMVSSALRGHRERPVEWNGLKSYFGIFVARIWFTFRSSH